MARVVGVPISITVYIVFLNLFYKKKKTNLIYFYFLTQVVGINCS